MSRSAVSKQSEHTAWPAVRRILVDHSPPHGAAVLREMATFLETLARYGSRREDPVRSVFARLGDRWSILLLQLLRVASFRHATLRRLASAVVPAGEKPISQRMLTLRLRMLERDGIIQRRVTAHVPPQVEYSLTPLGRDLVQKAHSLAMWVCERSARIREARRHYDRAARTPGPVKPSARGLP